MCGAYGVLERMPVCGGRTEGNEECAVCAGCAGWDDWTGAGSDTLMLSTAGGRKEKKSGGEKNKSEGEKENKCRDISIHYNFYRL